MEPQNDNITLDHTTPMRLFSELTVVVVAALLGPGIATALLIRNLKAIDRRKLALLLAILMQGFIVVSQLIYRLESKYGLIWWVFEFLVVVACSYFLFNKYFTDPSSASFRTGGNAFRSIFYLLLLNGGIRFALRAYEFDLNLTSIISSAVIILFSLIFPRHSLL